MKLGIVTLSFNQRQFLEEAIASVQLRDSSKLRYVIVDPGSTDGSRELIEKNSAHFTKIIFEPDRGPADGLNKGFAECEADIYGYLNSDDRFTPGALDWVLDFFEHNPSIDVILGAGRTIDAEGRARWRKSLSWSFTPRAILTGTSNIVQPASFFRRRAFLQTNGFNITNKTCWDFELLVDMLLKGAHCKEIYRVLAEFRLHHGGLTGAGSFKPGGRLRDLFEQDLARILRQLETQGFRRPSGIRLRRWAHTLNPLRRALELLVR